MQPDTTCTRSTDRRTSRRPCPHTGSRHQPGMTSSHCSSSVACWRPLYGPSSDTGSSPDRSSSTNHLSLGRPPRPRAPYLSNFLLPTNRTYRPKSFAPFGTVPIIEPVEGGHSHSWTAWRLWKHPAAIGLTCLIVVE